MTAHPHYPVNPPGGFPTGNAIWEPDPGQETLWDGSFWKGIVGDIGVEFKVEIALGSTGDGDTFLYDDPASLYDTARYSVNDITWQPLTSRVEDISVNRGRDALADTFRPGSGSLLLSNQDGVFNPLQGQSIIGDQAMRPGRWVRLSGKRTDSDDWEPLFVGRVLRLGDTYEDAAHRIFSRWQLVGLETILSTRQPPPENVPDPASAGQTTDERVRYVWEDKLAFPPEFLITEPGVATMLETDFPGSRLDQMNQAVNAEFGAFFVDRSGIFQFKHRGWLQEGEQGTVQFSIGDYQLAPVVVLDASTSWDMVRIRNAVFMTREGGVQQGNINSTSQGLYGEITWTRSDLQNETDVQVVDLVQLHLDAFSFDTLRLDSVEVWSPELDGVDNLLKVELGHRVRVQIVTGAGWSYAIDAWVNGIEHQVTASDWKVRLRLDNTFRGNPLLGGAFSTAHSSAFNRVE